MYCATTADDDLTKVASRFAPIDVKVHLRADASGGGSDWDAAAPEDFSEIRAIAGEAFRGLTRFYRDPGFAPAKADEMYKIWVDRGLREADVCVVVARADRIQGFSLVRLGREAAIELLAVAPVFRGAGVGAALVRQSFAAAKGHGCSTIRLTTEEHNIPALNLYRKMGFHTSGSHVTWHWWAD